jgi:hypothetical protein
MPNTHIVCKPLPTADGVLPSGTCVDASDWAKLDRLIHARYLRPIGPDDNDEQPAAPPKRARGREVQHAE